MEKIKRKRLLWVIILIVMITEFVMYNREHHLRLQEEKTTRQLVQQYRTLQDKNDMMSRTMDQITHHDQSVQAEGVFMDQRKYYRINWENYIHVSLSDYSTGIFGGIKNMQVQVSNQTDYPLDNVTVSVEYIKSDGTVFQTATVNVPSVQPKSVKSVAAPDSRRGVTAKLDLERITSQSLNFCWTPEKGKLPAKMDSCQCAVGGGR